MSFFEHSQIIFEIVSMAATLNRQLKNVCMLSGFRYGKYKVFAQAAMDLGQVLVSETTYTRGSQVLGIILHPYNLWNACPAHQLQIS